VIVVNKTMHSKPVCNQGKTDNAEISTKRDVSRKNITQRKKRISFLMTLCSIFSYFLLFHLINQYYGQAMAISAIIPVIIIGWFYGFIPGLCAGILSYPLNILMYLVFGADGLQGMIVGGGGITGTVSLILIGAMIGRVRDLSNQLRKHRDRLDELVQLKTKELEESNKTLQLEINEKEEAFKGLEEAKVNLDNILNYSLDCIMLSDKTGHVSKVNKYFLELVGCKEEEIVGKFIAELTPVSIGQTYESITGELLTIDEAYSKRIQEMINTLLETGKVTNWEAYYLLQDGKVVPVEQNIVCLYDKEGERTGAVAIIRNITERKKSVNALRKTKEDLNNLIESSRDGIIATGEEGNITRVNRTFLESLGYKENEVIGKHITEFSIRETGTYELTTGDSIEITKRYFHDQNEMISKLLQGTSIINRKSYFIRKDGKVIPCEQNISPLYNQKGKVEGAVGIIRDITERLKSERNITEIRDFLDNIFKTAADGIIVTDPNGFMIMVNGSVEKITGYAKEELIGKHAKEMRAEGKEYEEAGTTFFEKVFRDGNATESEMAWVKKDGSFVFVEMSAALLKDNKGNITGSVANIRDITQRKQAERELKEAKEHLDNLIENSLDCIMVSDKVGNITKVNRYFLDLLGFSEDEILGKHVMDCTPMMEEGTYECTTGENLKIGKEFIEDANGKIANLLEDGNVINWETYYFCKDKRVVPIEQNIVCLYNKLGERTGAVAIIRDTTERKKAEKELRETKDFLEKIIESTKDGVLITDAQGNIGSCNTSIEKMTGLSKNDLIGSHASTLVVDDKDVKAKILEKTAELFEKGHAIFEAQYKAVNEGWIDIECISSMVSNEKGDHIAGVSIVRDITERKMMQQQLIQSEKLKSLGELAGGVAHDFNNVLAAILGRAQLLKMQFKPPQGKQEKRKAMIDLIKSLEIIERASSDGAETVRRIQEFSRKRSDDKEFTQVDINELLKNSLEFTSVRWKGEAESRGIKINIEKEFSSLPSTSGSAAELREVFTNIINNAVDAMPQGGTIQIKTATENNLISIEIKDTGIGIPEHIKNRIFDPFFTTKGVQSTGLGMSTSYGIINRHKGTILVDSTEGKNTTFTIKIPINSTLQGMEEKTKTTLQEKKEGTILVIEDEEDVRTLLADILTENGHHVVTASDGSQGIDLFKENDFDLIFTDLGMPGVSGWQVAETVKSINDKIPVAVITGWNVELEESEMRAKGVDFIVNKPFEKTPLNCVYPTSCGFDFPPKTLETMID
jgi:PAS domain S-box-containing protein